MPVSAATNVKALCSLLLVACGQPSTADAANGTDTYDHSQNEPQLLASGTKLPIAEMGAMLREQGHKQVMIFGRLTYDEEREPDERWFFQTTLLTTNPDQGNWYLLFGNQPLNTQSTEMFIAAAGTELSVYNQKTNDRLTIEKHGFSRRFAIRDMANLDQHFVDMAENDSPWGREGFEVEGKTYFDLQKTDFYDDLITTMADEHDLRVVFEGRLASAKSDEPQGWVSFLLNGSNASTVIVQTTNKGASFSTWVGTETGFFPLTEELLNRSAEDLGE